MDRRELVNVSLASVGAAAMWPVLKFVQHALTADALNQFHGFVETRPWRFDAAVEFLESLGDQRCQALRAVITNGNTSACCLAICMVRRLGPSALPLLPELIRIIQEDGHPDSDRAVIALGKIGPSAASAVSVLEDRLNNTDLLIRLDVANSLVEIQPHRMNEWASIFHAGLNDFSTAFRACLIVSEFGGAGVRFVPQLESLVGATSEGVRPDIHCEAARAILRITGDPELNAVQRALRTEQQLLSSPDDRVRRFVASRPIGGTAVQRIAD